MSFVSASRAVHVQVSPAPLIGFFIAETFFLFGCGEAPNFIALNALGLYAPHMLVMEDCANLASFFEELRYGVDRHIAYARDRPHGRTFAEHCEDLDARGDRELVHVNQTTTT
jgi:hypothetical protein